jgi:8-oxo-dGTP pyrophosphatase MutT (NUDIX family)
MRPWKRLASAPVVKNRWLNVTADKCQLPNGTVIEPYFVLHEPEWVHILALNQAVEVLAVCQYRYAADAVCTELPGGVVERDEEPLFAAKRELLEETGYVASSWSYVGSLFANPARQTNRIHLFVAKDLAVSAAQNLDASEEITVKFLSAHAVQAAIDCGEFSQALHVASYYRGTHYLGRASDA